MSDERLDESETEQEKGLAVPDEELEIEIISIGDEEGVTGADEAIDGSADAGAMGLELELAELNERYVRLRADFENYRKRVERDRAELARRALTEPIGELLPVLDNLERALAAPGDEPELRTGVELILKQLVETLRRFGLSEIPAQGQPFDPRGHEAVAREEDATVEAPTVIAELQRGYWLNERLLRPAMVRVAVPPEDTGAAAVEAAAAAETEGDAGS